MQPTHKYVVVSDVGGTSARFELWLFSHIATTSPQQITSTQATTTLAHRATYRSIEYNSALHIVRAFVDECRSVLSSTSNTSINIQQYKFEQPHKLVLGVSKNMCMTECVEKLLVRNGGCDLV